MKTLTPIPLYLVLSVALLFSCKKEQPIAPEAQPSAKEESTNLLPGPGDKVSRRVGYYRLTNVNSGKVLAVPESSTAAGVGIVQWQWANIADQKWDIEYVSNGNYKIINANSGLALAVGRSSHTPGAGIVQWYWSNIDDQLWKVEFVQSGNIYRFVNVNSGQVLAIGRSATHNGAEAVQYPWADINDQKWVLQYLN